MRTRMRGKSAKPKAGVSPVSFPRAVSNPKKLSDDKLAAKLAEGERAVAQASRLELTGEQLRAGQGDAVLGGLKRTVETVAALRREREFRAETARLDTRSFWDGLRGQPHPKERQAAWETARKEQAEAKAAQRADLERRRAEEMRARHEQLVKAGYVYAPLGGWDFDGSDALAAVFGSALIWEWLDKRPPEGAVLTVHDLGFLLVCLALIAESGGKEVRVRVDHFPRLPEEWRGDRNQMVEHLRRNGLIEIEREGVQVTIRRGPRVEALRRSFQEQMLARAQAGS